MHRQACRSRWRSTSTSRRSACRNLVKIQQTLAKIGKICEILGKTAKKSAIFNENFEIRERKLKWFQDNCYSTKGAHISSAYSSVNIVIFVAAPFHRSSKWLAARCLLASRFLVFFLFGVVLARPFFPHFSPVDSKTVQRSALCRSRRELSNEYLLVKFGVDTAENEPI